MRDLSSYDFNVSKVSTQLLISNAAIPTIDIRYVDHLISNGADVNGYDKKGNTALHVLSTAGNLKLVEHLIKIGANVTLLNQNNHTSVDLAKANKHFFIVRSLRIASLTVLDKALLKAISVSDFSKAKALIEQGANIESCNLEGLTPLHIATLVGSVEIVDYLIEKKVNLNAVDDNGVSALHYTMMYETDYHRKIAFNLVKNGANPNLGNSSDFNFLYKTAYRGYDEVLNLTLMKKVNVNEFFLEYNLTALHAAATNGHKTIVYLLLAHGADVTIRNHHNNTAHEMAKDKNFINLAKLLNSIDTKFISAAANGKIDLVKAFHIGGANINAVGHYNENALNLAIKFCHVATFTYLLEQGVLISTDIFGENSLHIAAKNKCYKAMDRLIQHGVDPKAVNWLGLTPLDLAKEYQYTEINYSGEVATLQTTMIFN